MKGEWVKNQTQLDWEKKTSVTIQTIQRYKQENDVDEKESIYNTWQQWQS